MAGSAAGLIRDGTIAPYWAEVAVYDSCETSPVGESPHRARLAGTHDQLVLIGAARAGIAAVEQRDILGALRTVSTIMDTVMIERRAGIIINEPSNWTGYACGDTWIRWVYGLVSVSRAHRAVQYSW